MGDETVRVVVRSRPMNSREVSDARKPCVVVSPDEGTVVVRNPDAGALAADEKSFTFDAVYDDASTQRAVYDETAFPLVEAVLSGYNGTIFAYGQTGCGKTHTMQGRAEPAELRGIIPNSFDHIFDHIAVASAAKEKKTEFLVRVSYLEIYNEEIRDLLNAKSDDGHKMELHEDPDRGVYVKDLTMVTVDNVAAIDKVMTAGNKHRCARERGGCVAREVARAA
jgi:kinesin family protein 3/17